MIDLSNQTNIQLLDGCKYEIFLILAYEKRLIISINLFMKPAGEGLAQHHTVFTDYIGGREGGWSSDYRRQDSRHPRDLALQKT